MLKKFQWVGLFMIFVLNTAYADRLAVVSRAENQVAFIDLKTGQVTATVATGLNPHEIAVDNQGRFAYAPAFGGSRIAKVDLQNEKLASLFEIDGHRGMHSAAWMDGFLWVTAEAKKLILKVDPTSGEVLAELPTGGDRSHMLVAVPSQNRLFVANMGSSTVSVINPGSGERELIATGAAPEGIDVTPDGHHVWVSNRGENTLSVIEPKTNQVLKQFASEGDFPVKLRIRPDGEEVWVANNRSASIAVFDAKTLQHKQNIQVGARPLGIAFSQDSSKAYVSRPGASLVLEIDTAEFKILRTIETPKSPDGIAYVLGRKPT